MGQRVLSLSLKGSWATFVPGNQGQDGAQRWSTLVSHPHHGHQDFM